MQKCTRQLVTFGAELTANSKDPINLLALVESGVIEHRDPDIVLRFADPKSRRLNLERQIDEMEQLTAKKLGAITDEHI